jgi:ABC-2 type transport system permease protein
MTWSEQVWAVALRDIRKSTSWKKIILSSCMTLCVLFLIGLGVRVVLPGGADGLDSFVIAGLLGLLVSITAFSTVRLLVLDKRKYMKLLLIAPVSDSAIITGKIVCYLFSVVPNILFSLVFFTWYAGNWSLLSVALGITSLLLIVLTFFGLSFVIASFFSSERVASEVYEYSSIYFLFVSGAFYSISSFPDILKWLFFLNPAFYAVEATRYSVSGTALLSPWLSFSLLAAFALLFSSIGTTRYVRTLRTAP